MRLRVPDGKQYLIHGRMYKAGDEFDAPDKEAALWKLTGMAEDSLDIPPTLRRRGRPPKSEEREPARYERKDMRAQDE